MSILTYNKAVSKKLSTNFNSTEFDCHGNGCCNSTQIDEKLVDYLQKIRDFFGKSVKINSGYRCKTHNSRVGGASRSNHMFGQAADIAVSGIKPIEVARYAESIGVLGIGVYSSFVHIDTRTNKYFWYDGGASNVSTFGTLQYKPAQTTQIKEKIGVISSNSDEDAEKIWNFLLKEISNPYGVAGLMGNLYAESSMRSNNLQNSYESKLGYKDDSYTKAVDNNSYSNFVKDSAGYGLAQWTYWSRKQNLLNYALEQNKSIGDYEMQLEFLIEELKNNYQTVFQTLKEATSVKQASDIVLLKFENPANKGTSVQQKRAQYGQIYFNKFSSIKKEDYQEQLSTSLQEEIIGYAIAKTAIHIRAGSNTTFKSYGIIKAGTQLEVLEILNNGWYKVIWTQSENGYAYTSNVSGSYYDYIPKKEENVVKITASALNIRAGAGTNYKINGQLKKNSVHTIIEQKDGWGKLKSNKGWIKLSYTEKVNYNE